MSHSKLEWAIGEDGNFPSQGLSAREGNHQFQETDFTLVLNQDTYVFKRAVGNV